MLLKAKRNMRHSLCLCCPAIDKCYCVPLNHVLILPGNCTFYYRAHMLHSTITMKKLIKMMKRKNLNHDNLLLCPPVQLSCRGDLSKPHECTIPCGEERGRRRLGKEISGWCIQTWNDIIERTQVRLWETQASCCCINTCSYSIYQWCNDVVMHPGALLTLRQKDLMVFLPLQVSWRNSCVSVQCCNTGGH